MARHHHLAFFVAAASVAVSSGARSLRPRREPIDKPGDEMAAREHTCAQHYCASGMPTGRSGSACGPPAHEPCDAVCCNHYPPSPSWGSYEGSLTQAPPHASASSAVLTQAPPSPAPSGDGGVAAPEGGNATVWMEWRYRLQHRDTLKKQMLGPIFYGISGVSLIVASALLYRFRARNRAQAQALRRRRRRRKCNPPEETTAEHLTVIRGIMSDVAQVSNGDEAAEAGAKGVEVGGGAGGGGGGDEEAGADVYDAACCCVCLEDARETQESYEAELEAYEAEVAAAAAAAAAAATSNPLHPSGEEEDEEVGGVKQASTAAAAAAENRNEEAVGLSSVHVDLAFSETGSNAGGDAGDDNGAAAATSQQEGPSSSTTTTSAEENNAAAAAPASDAAEAAPSGPPVLKTWARLACGHTIHHECLEEWLLRRLVKGHSLSCPVCRSFVTPACEDAHEAVRRAREGAHQHEMQTQTMAEGEEEGEGGLGATAVAEAGVEEVGAGRAGHATVVA